MYGHSLRNVIKPAGSLEIFRKPVLRLVVNFVIFWLIYHNLTFIGYSNALLSDEDKSDNNYFQAATLDLAAISSPDSLPPLMPGQAVDKTILIENSGSLDAFYSISIQFLEAVGSLCPGLFLEVTSDASSAHAYSGLLSEFVLENQSLNTASSSIWLFSVKLADDVLPGGQTCDFNLSFSGSDAASSSLSKFTDLEIEHFSIVSGIYSMSDPDLTPGLEIGDTAEVLLDVPASDPPDPVGVDVDEETTFNPAPDSGVTIETKAEETSVDNQEIFSETDLIEPERRSPVRDAAVSRRLPPNLPAYAN